MKRSSIAQTDHDKTDSMPANRTVKFPFIKFSPWKEPYTDNSFEHCKLKKHDSIQTSGYKLLPFYFSRQLTAGKQSLKLHGHIDAVPWETKWKQPVVYIEPCKKLIQHIPLTSIIHHDEMAFKLPGKPMLLITHPVKVSILGQPPGNSQFLWITLLIKCILTQWVLVVITLFLNCSTIRQLND